MQKVASVSFPPFLSSEGFGFLTEVRIEIERIQIHSTKLQSMGVAFLGEIPFEAKIEEIIGNINKLLETVFSEKVEEIISKI